MPGEALVKMLPPGPEERMERFLGKYANNKVALDLRTGEWRVTTQEERDMMADPAYQEFLQRIMCWAMQPRKHVWIRNVGRAC